MREALFTKTAPPPPELEDLWLCMAFNCSIMELQEMSAEFVLQTADQRIDGLGAEVLQLFHGGHLFGIAEKAVDQIIENPKPEQGCASVQ